MERSLKTPESTYPARWWHRLPEEQGKPAQLQCDLCPRDCKLLEGQRGACFVRQNLGGEMILSTYGRSSGFSIDRIERNPLYHFYPGSSLLSLGTAGCNLACNFCQHGDVAKAADLNRLMDAASPEGIASAAAAYGAQGVAFAYNDPVIYAEYALDTAQAFHRRQLKTVAVTASYLHPQPAREFFSVMDAANVDLKAFSDDFYVKHCGGHLQPILDALAFIHHETDCWLEITTLLIPGQNDSPAEIKALAQWVRNELGPDVPLHFTAFDPRWKMKDWPHTPRATLIQARRIAQETGLHHVYTGNVHDSEGGSTFCPACQAVLIERDSDAIRHYDLTENACCPHCQTLIAGHFGKLGKPSGSHRLPVRLARR